MWSGIMMPGFQFKYSSIVELLIAKWYEVPTSCVQQGRGQVNRCHHQGLFALPLPQCWKEAFGSPVLVKKN